MDLRHIQPLRILDELSWADPGGNGGKRSVDIRHYPLMTKTEFFRFLLQHQVPLRIAQRVVDIIDGKVRGHIVLNQIEVELIALAEVFNGPYYMTPIADSPPLRNRGDVTAVEKESPSQEAGHQHLDVGATGQRRSAAALTVTEPRESDVAFVQACARRVIEEDQ